MLSNFGEIWRPDSPRGWCRRPPERDKRKEAAAGAAGDAGDAMDADAPARYALAVVLHPGGYRIEPIRAKAPISRDAEPKRARGDAAAPAPDAAAAAPAGPLLPYFAARIFYARVAAGTRIFGGDESRRRRGWDVDLPWRPVAAARRGYSLDKRRGRARRG